MEDAMRSILPIAAALVAPILLALGGSRLIRWVTNHEADRVADELIAANKARWCEEKDGMPMDRTDWKKVDRAAETRWQ